MGVLFTGKCRQSMVFPCSSPLLLFLPVIGKHLTSFVYLVSACVLEWSIHCFRHSNSSPKYYGLIVDLKFICYPSKF
uniref:Uncharacterized protein n=1 Tax=Rhizophora mucronata TaxID=61149 RepID=A0A2P2IK49_RHIMU